MYLYSAKISFSIFWSVPTWTVTLSVGSTPVKVLLKLFDCVVAPVLLYGCEVWGANTLGKIASPQQFSSKFFSIITFAEKLHLKFCKRILGVHTKVSNVAVYAEWSGAPLITKITITVLKFWARINEKRFEHTLVGQASKVCAKLNLPIARFTRLLHQMVGNENTSHSSLKTRLFKLFEKYAIDLIRGSDKNVMNGKLRTFRLFKKNLSQEKYLLETRSNHRSV